MALVVTTMLVHDHMLLQSAHLEGCCCCQDCIRVAEDVPQAIRAQDDKAVLVGLEGQPRHIWLALHKAGWLLKVQVTQ